LIHIFKYLFANVHLFVIHLQIMSGKKTNINGNNDLQVVKQLEKAAENNHCKELKADLLKKIEEIKQQKDILK